LRGEVRRQASPIARAGSGPTKRKSLTRLSRTSALAATSGNNVTPYPFATICITVASEVAPRLAGASLLKAVQKASAWSRRQ
jgi:hypothetical protein